MWREEIRFGSRSLLWSSSGLTRQIETITAPDDDDDSGSPPLTVYMGKKMQPASETKHLQQLPYEFNAHTFLLHQRDAHGLTNGTTLWLGGQVLSYYLASILIRDEKKTAIELGSGIGLTA